MWQPEMFVDVGACPLGWGLRGSHLTGEPLFKSDVHTGIVFETKSQLKAQRFLVLRCVADIWGKRSQSSWIPECRMNPQSVAVSSLPSFLLSSQGGAIKGSRPNPRSGYCGSCFPRAPLTAEPLACSRTGCFFHTYVGCLDWGSSLGRYPGIVFSFVTEAWKKRHQT